MNQNGGIHKGGFAVLCHRNGGLEKAGKLTQDNHLCGEKSWLPHKSCFTSDLKHKRGKAKFFS